MKSIRLAPLAESILREEENKKKVAAMDAAMGAAFKDLGSLFQSEEDEIKKDVEQSKGEVKEALGIIGVIGIILAAPKVVDRKSTRLNSSH